jgi:uncharacterized membrane protein YedE/YeeE
MLATVAVTTIAWLLAVTFGPSTDKATLENFYRLVRPAGPGWRTVRASTGLDPSPDSLPRAMLGWLTGILLVYAAMFGIGTAVAGRPALAGLWGLLFVASSATLAYILKSHAREST